jgi:hypothetical protein
MGKPTLARRDQYRLQGARDGLRGGGEGGVIAWLRRPPWAAP